jgi:hypothetical protein
VQPLQANEPDRRRLPVTKADAHVAGRKAPPRGSAGPGA